MNKIFLLLFTLVLLISCSSSKSVTTIAKGNDISMYKYVVYIVLVRLLELKLVFEHDIEGVHIVHLEPTVEIVLLNNGIVMEDAF